MTIAFQPIKTSIWRPARLFMATSLVLSGMLAPQTASAATITNVFTGIVDLNFFGGTGADEFQLTYTFDSELPNLPSIPGLGRYGPFTGNVRVDSLGFDFDFNASNSSPTILGVQNNATLVFPVSTTIDLFSINIATSNNIQFGSELIRGFGLTLIDEDATIFSSTDLLSGTAFFAGIDAINLRINIPIFDPNSTQDGSQLFVISKDSSSLVGVSAVPVPAALPLFASGLGLFGLLGWMRRRKIAV